MNIGKMFLSLLFNGMKNEVYYNHMLSFSQTIFSFIQVVFFGGKSWKDLYLSRKYFDGYQAKQEINKARRCVQVYS